MKRARIVLADDHAILRDGLCSVIVHDLKMEVVGQADDGRTTVKLARSLRPDIVIMDINMPGLNGIDATRQIREEMPEVKVIALSMHRDAHHVSGMLKAGASAYVLKVSAADELRVAIWNVLDNKKYISPEIADVVIDDCMNHTFHNPGENSESKLTSREREILQLISEGKSTKEIAALLDVGLTTVDTHRQHIMEKLDLHSIAELTKYAIRLGLTSLD